MTPSASSRLHRRGDQVASLHAGVARRHARRPGARVRARLVRLGPVGVDDDGQPGRPGNVLEQVGRRDEHRKPALGDQRLVAAATQVLEPVGLGIPPAARNGESGSDAAWRLGRRMSLPWQTIARCTPARAQELDLVEHRAVGAEVDDAPTRRSRGVKRLRDGTPLRALPRSRSRRRTAWARHGRRGTRTRRRGCGT